VGLRWEYCSLDSEPHFHFGDLVQTKWILITTRQSLFSGLTRPFLQRPGDWGTRVILGYDFIPLQGRVSTRTG
jgi:hypothetical protein